MMLSVRVFPTVLDKVQLKRPIVETEIGEFSAISVACFVQCHRNITSGTALQFHKMPVIGETVII